MENILGKLTVYDIAVCADIFSSAGTRRDITNRNWYGLIFSTKGKVNYYHNGSVYTTDENHFILVPQKSTYYLVCEQEDVSPVLNFYCNLNLDKFMSFEFSDRQIIGDAEKVVTLWTDKRPGWQLTAKSLIYKILSALFDGNRNTIFPTHVKTAISFIYKNYGDCTLDNAQIAASANISQIYLQKEFIKYIGQPPQKFLQKIRINNAAELLVSGTLTVSDISQKTGYASVYHFSRAFKNIMGMSPLQYRKSSGIM